MTEADLTKLVQRVIQEQSQVSQIKSVDTVKPASQSAGKLVSVDNVKATTPKQSMGTITSVMTKSTPEEWFSNFPCIKDMSPGSKKMVGGKLYVKDMDGKQRVFLPESGKGTGYDSESREALNGYLGKIQGGGVYFCHSASYAKGMGPQMAI